MTRFENAQIFRDIAKSLKVKGTANGPTELDTSSLKGVISLDPGMIGEEEHQLVASSSIAGLTGWDWQAVGSDGSFTTPALLNGAAWRNNIDRCAVILGLRVEVAFPGNTAIAAEDGAQMVLWEYRQASNSPVSVMRMSTFDPAFIANQAKGQYIWSYPMWQNFGYQPGSGEGAPNAIWMGPMAASPIYIPAGARWGLAMQYWNPVAAVTAPTLRAFPVGTTVAVHAQIVSCPRGMRPPGM